MSEAYGSGMLIEVADIPFEGKVIAGELSASVLDIEDEDFFRIGESFCYKLRIQAVSGEMIVSGTLEIDVLFMCSRCAEFFPARVVEPEFITVCRITENNESVDLTADVREAILLAFSAYPVCKPDCKGVCPRCGKNLNEGDCKCKSSPDGRWSALDVLEN